MCHTNFGFAGSSMLRIAVPFHSILPVIGLRIGSSLPSPSSDACGSLRSFGVSPTYTQLPLAGSDFAVSCSPWRPCMSWNPTSRTFSAPSDRGSAGCDAAFDVALDAGCGDEQAASTDTNPRQAHLFIVIANASSGGRGFPGCRDYMAMAHCARSFPEDI